MGHYVLNHIYKDLVLTGVVLVIGFAFLNWGINEAWRDGRELGHSWYDRLRGFAAGGDHNLVLFLHHHPGRQYHHPNHGVRGGHVRP